MTDQTVVHATFSIRRICHASAQRVFRAFADPKEKQRWQDSAEVQAVEPDASDDYLEFDFRVGGHERFAFQHEGVTYEYDAQYFDIVQDRRIVYRYTMMADGRPDSISTVAIELIPDEGGTAVIYTEQDTFLDGIDEPAPRQAGVTDLVDKLVAYLKRP